MNAHNSWHRMTQTLLDDAAVDAFLAAPAVGPSIDWDAPPPAPPEPKPADPYSWDDLDPGPSESDPSWAAFGAAAEDAADASSGTKKKLSAAEREKARDEQMLRDARESIRKRGWTEGEVKWRSWLARRGHDTMVHDWNLYRYIDGDCIPPSRDPFWLNANEVPLPDYEAGNDVPNEVGPMEVTSILGERIEPKWKPPRVVQLEPLWHDVDSEDLITRGLGRLAET